MGRIIDGWICLQSRCQKQIAVLNERNCLEFPRYSWRNGVGWLCLVERCVSRCDTDRRRLSSGVLSCGWKRLALTDRGLPASHRRAA